MTELAAVSSNHPPEPPSSNSTSRIYWIVGIAAVIGLGLIFFFWPKNKHDEGTKAPSMQVDERGVTLAPDAPQWKYVELKVAEEAPPLPPLPAPGRVDLEPSRTASIVSPLAGRIETVNVRLGDAVKQGDKLFSVRSSSFADLDRDLQSARADVAVKKRLADRMHELLQLKAVPEKDVLAADADLKQAELTLATALSKQQSLSVEGVGQNLFWVHAPRTGVVVDVDVSPGEGVTPEREKPLMRVSDLDEVVVYADVQENDAADITVGTKVNIHEQIGNFDRQGQVEHISEVIDPKRRTVEVRVRAVNPDHALKPNAFVEVTVEPDNGSKRVRVPNEAVVTEGNKSLVFVARGPGRLERVPVIPGRQRDGETEVRTGLTPGTSYVARGALLLLNQVDLAQ